MPDHPAVWLRTDGDAVWHRQLDPDFARGSRISEPDRRTVCGAVLAGTILSAGAPLAQACVRCLEMNDHEARFPPT